MRAAAEFGAARINLSHAGDCVTEALKKAAEAQKKGKQFRFVAYHDSSEGLRPGCEDFIGLEVFNEATQHWEQTRTHPKVIYENMTRAEEDQQADLLIKVFEQRINERIMFHGDEKLLARARSEVAAIKALPKADRGAKMQALYRTFPGFNL